MICSIEVQDTPDGFILFRDQAFKDMVGETAIVREAFRFDPDTLQAGEAITYPELRAIYKKIVGRNTRKAFWGAIRWLSPEQLEQDREDTRAEAISRVI